MTSYYSSQHWLKLRDRALRRDGHTCVVVGCMQRAVVVDHIKTRPRASCPTSFDVLENCRSLCMTHDAQAKERPDGTRKAPRVIGCGTDGVPNNPLSHWHKP